VNKEPQVSFQTLVNPFGLTIGLGMVCTTHKQIHFEQFEEFLPNLAGKHLVPIRYQSLGQTMQLGMQ
jgi:hypothetical protein